MRKLIRRILPISCGALVVIAVIVAQALYAEEKVNTAVVAQPRQGKAAQNWLRAHEKRTRKVPKGKVPILFVGDSITQNWLAKGKGGKVWGKYYRPMRCANIGQAGDRTENILWRIQNGGLGQVKPEVTVLLAGTNNIKINTAPEIAAGVTAIVEELKKQLPETKVLLLGIFPRSGAKDPMREKIKAVNEILAKLNDDPRVEYCDVGGIFLEDTGELKKGITLDGLHPSEAGYELLVNALDEPIKKLRGATPAKDE